MANFMKNFQSLKRFFATITTLCAFLLPHSTFGANDSNQGVKVIVLDAGHGGRYSGAYYEGICEKDINLQVVLKLGALIKQKMPNIKVVYTRTTDKHFSESIGPDLQARADIAHRNNGDLFISVHSNAMPGKSSVKGTLTLVMGETSREVSQNENALYANNKEELLDMSDHKTATIVRAYIQNLQYTYGVYSEMMARFIQNEYVAIGLRDHGVRGQPLKVLYSTDMPSVLTEIGFMSNPDDLKHITSEEGQNEIVQALFRAIERYVDIVNRSLLVDNPGAKTKQVQPKASKEPAKAEPKKEEPKKEVTSTPAKEQPQKQTKTVKRYTIQLMPGKEKIPVSRFDFKALQDKVWILEAGGNWPYKYCYGEYVDLASAKQHLEEAKKYFQQAFIISFEKQE